MSENMVHEPSRVTTDSSADERAGIVPSWLTRAFALLWVFHILDALGHYAENRWPEWSRDVWVLLGMVGLTTCHAIFPSLMPHRLRSSAVKSA